MAALPDGYQRKGKVVTFQLDFDAWALLQALAPTSKAYGRYLSELIRRDAIRRHEWEKVRAGLPVLVEVDARGDLRPDAPTPQHEAEASVPRCRVTSTASRKA